MLQGRENGTHHDTKASEAKYRNHRLTALELYFQAQLLNHGGVRVSGTASGRMLREDIEALAEKYGNKGTTDFIETVDAFARMNNQGYDSLDSEIIEAGPFVFRPRLGIIQTPYPTPREVELTRLESRITHILVANPNVIIPYDRIVDFAWGYDGDGSPNLLKTHMCHVRTKVGDPLIPNASGKQMKHKHFKVKNGIGYFFNLG